MAIGVKLCYTCLHCHPCYNIWSVV